MIIDSCYESVVEKLTRQGKILKISNQLLSLNRNDERVLLVYKVFEDLQAFPVVENVNKNDAVSVYYRNQGNTCFKQSEYHKAWQYYNLSLLFAISLSENVCLALSNRSAVFYELKKFDECLQDIDKVFSLEYPQKILEKLIKRKEMCKKALLNDNNREPMDMLDSNEILKMKSANDPRYLCASNKLEVVCTDYMGRHVIAKEDIKVGEVLAEEEPYLTLLLKSQILCGCSYCLSQNCNLLPCDSCCLALYCCTECKEKAWREYHSIECPLMVSLINMDFTKLELLALRTVIKARQDHKDWNRFYETIEFADANYNSEFRGHVKTVTNKWIYDSKYYASIHTLATNVEKRSVSDIFQKCVTAVVLLRFLEVNTKFLDVDCEIEKEKIKNTVGGLLLLHLMTSPTNMHGISTVIENDKGHYEDELNLACAPYAFCSLINHSCAPNVVRFTKLGTGKMSLFAIRPIKKGMQIFDNYGQHHGLHDWTSRQKDLKFQYKFTCMCEACIDNWPTYFSLTMQPIRRVPANISKSVRNILTQETIEQLQKGDKTTAMKIYRHLCIMCEILEPYAPCMELCDCQESLKQCLAIFKGLSPYGSTQLIEWKTLTSATGDMVGFVQNVFKKLTV